MNEVINNSYDNLSKANIKIILLNNKLKTILSINIYHSHQLMIT